MASQLAESGVQASSGRLSLIALVGRERCANKVGPQTWLPKPQGTVQLFVLVCVRACVCVCVQCSVVWCGVVWCVRAPSTASSGFR